MPIIGTQQSPIRIDKSATLQIVVPENYLDPNYSGAELRGHFDFETDNFVFEEFEYFLVGNQPWVIRKIHFHDLAEHLIAGRDRARYEAHIVHTMGTSPCDDLNATGPKLALGTFFHRDGAAQPRYSARKLNEQLKEWTESKGARGYRGKIEARVNPLDFLPPRDCWKSWYHYQGSLTSEPFSEDVTWYVFDRETGVQDGDFCSLAGAEQHARGVHAIDRRFVLRSFP